MSADPVARHVAELALALRGPARVRRSMLAETRDGLHDAAAAYREGGLPVEQAARCAVRDFGSVGEIAPLYQEELLARQSRWAALQLTVVFPAMVLAWDLLWRSGLGWKGPSVPLVSVLARLQDVASWGVAAVALGLLLCTFHRGFAPRRLAWGAGMLGAIGVLVCGGSAVVMALSSGVAEPGYLVTGPVPAVAYGCSATVLVLVARSVVRTLRAAALG
jgi:hypothetical protein